MTIATDSALFETSQVPTLEILRENRDRIIAIFQKHGASNIKIFGSVARGEAAPESDIDFFCDYDIAKITPFFPSGPAVELQDFLGKDVDIASKAMFKSPQMAERVQQDLDDL